MSLISVLTLTLVLLMKGVNALSTTRADNKMRILCLHGYMQSAATFSSKIGGARRKLERVYDLHFLNGPIVLDSTIKQQLTQSLGNDSKEKSLSSKDESAYAWWTRDESTGRHKHVREAFDYIQEHTRHQRYDAILGFSQGGTLATALVLSGIIPGVRAVVTAGAPHVEEVFRVVQELSVVERKSTAGKETPANPAVKERGHVYHQGLLVPKLHFAGETDEMVVLQSTRDLSEHGGSGILEIHDQGHLFPTRAVRVKRVLEFLEDTLCAEHQ